MRTEPFPENEFTDPAVREAYARALATKAAVKTGDDLSKMNNAAYEQRNQAFARGPLLEAACTYLMIAQSGKTVDKTEPAKLYHFAANAFRDLGYLQHAAACYYNAALVGYNRYASIGEGSASFARRSAGRAKTMFAELGDDDNSDDAHELQQEIRRKELLHENLLLYFVYCLWGLVSRFGASPARWIKSTLIAIVSFAFLYALLICCGQAIPAGDIQRTGWWSIITSSLYFSVCNLFQFGTLGTLTPKSLLAQLVAVGHGIVAFILVGTGATFLTKR